MVALLRNSRSDRPTSLDLLLSLNPGVVLETWTFQEGHAVVDLIRVPPELRRRGIGSMVYLAWERTLPEAATVELHAVDQAAEAFWTSLGFARSSSGRMVKIRDRPSSATRSHDDHPSRQGA